MNEQNFDKDADVLDQAVQALRAVPTAADPRAGLVDSTVAMLAESSAATALTSRRRKRRLLFAGFGAAAAVLLCAGLYSFGLNDGSSSYFGYTRMAASQRVGGSTFYGEELSPGTSHQGLNILEGFNAKQAADRKIISTAKVDVKVAEFAKAEQDLAQAVKAQSGSIAYSAIKGNVGSGRYGVWTVRVPLAQFSEFCEAAKKLGELVQFVTDAKDVTEEFVDLRIRITNKEAELEALRKIFAQNTGKIEEVLAVQREVNRAQTELEQLKGRQRYLENLTALTTVTIQIEERGAFVAPTALPPVPPTSFSTRIGDTFSGSVEKLVAVGRGVVLVTVAVAPWLPLIIVPAGVILVIVKRRRKVGQIAP